MTISNLCVAALLLALVIPALSSKRLPQGVKAPIAIGFALRVGYAFAHAVIRTMPGLDKDARLFGYEATDIANGFRSLNSGSSNGGSYLNFLGITIRETGASANLLQLTSSVTWLATVHLMIFLARRMEMSTRGLRLGLYAMALMPSSIMWTSGLMREAIEMFAVTALFAVVYLAQARPKLIHVVSLIAIGWLTKNVHAAMTAFAAAAAAMIVINVLSGGIGSTRVRRFAVLVALALSVPVLMPLANQALSSDENVTASSEVERRSSAVATKTSRAYYGSNINLSDPVGLALDLPIAVSRYLFTPFPWQVGTAVDLLALAEALIRLAVAVATHATAVPRVGACGDSVDRVLSFLGDRHVELRHGDAPQRRDLAAPCSVLRLAHHLQRPTQAGHRARGRLHRWTRDPS
jgi:hypothetical protein